MSDSGHDLQLIRAYHAEHGSDKSRRECKVCYLLEVIDSRHYVCEAHVPTRPSEEMCPCCEAVHAVAAAQQEAEQARRALEDCIPVLVMAISDASRHRGAGHGGTGNLTPMRNVVERVRVILGRSRGGSAPSWTLTP